MRAPLILPVLRCEPPIWVGFELQIKKAFAILNEEKVKNIEDSPLSIPNASRIPEGMPQRMKDESSQGQGKLEEGKPWEVRTGAADLRAREIWIIGGETAGERLK